jgi:hypothetical protein
VPAEMSPAAQATAHPQRHLEGDRRRGEQPLSRRIARSAAAIHRGPRKAKVKPIRQHAVEGPAMSAERVLGILPSGGRPTTALATVATN